ncbi:MAG: OsmC family protein [Promethearchaeota archaeon]
MQIKIEYSENLHFIASARGFSNIHIDEPKSFHGTNLGPSSVEYLLIGIGGCIGSTFIYCFRKNKIEIENFSIIVDGQLKHIGPKNRLRLINVDVFIDFKPKPGQEKEKIELCKKIYEEHCIVSNSIKAGLPINVKMNLIEEK